MSIVTRESIALMRANNVDDGHVININSMSGHRLVGLPMYSASKFAVTALTEGNFNSVISESLENDKYLICLLAYLIFASTTMPKMLHFVIFYKNPRLYNMSLLCGNMLQSCNLGVACVACKTTRSETFRHPHFFKLLYALVFRRLTNLLDIYA